MDERKYDFWAACIQNGYVGRLIEIVENAGGAKSLYNMKKEDMECRLGISKKMAEHISACRENTDIDREYLKIMSQGIEFINYKDADFPEELRTIPSPPYGLFVRGKLPRQDRPRVAIIGARACSEYGRLMAEYFGNGLAKKGIDVVSGMAWGIDGMAQMAALAAGGRSFGVLGCGVDVVYPNNNRRLYDRLSENENGLISEYAPGTKALSRLFPPRNRIISALSDVVLVVEAKAQSGTLITVDMACEQGKCVMVVPGRLTDPLSVGCLNLINEGAIPAVSVEAVAKEAIAQAAGRGVSGYVEEDAHEETVGMAKISSKEISSEKASLLRILDFNPKTVDEIADSSEIAFEKIPALLTEMELAGMVREVGVGAFVRCIGID